MRSARAFTLLEVMVAVAILGLGLTAILSAQAGAFATSAHTRHMSVAVGLARCKMSELEEHLLRDGLQELDENEQGPCCDGEDTPGVTCAWKIEKPELPEPKYGDLDLNAGLDLAGGGKEGGAGLGALGALSQVEQGKQGFEAGAGVGDIAKQLAGGGDPSAAAGASSAMAGMVMNLVYPDLKTLFEASIRRVTVTLKWTEGTQEYSIDLAQWVTNPQETAIGADSAADAVQDVQNAAGLPDGAKAAPLRQGQSLSNGKGN